MVTKHKEDDMLTMLAKRWGPLISMLVVMISGAVKVSSDVGYLKERIDLMNAKASKDDERLSTIEKLMAARGERLDTLTVGQRETNAKLDQLLKEIMAQRRNP